MKYRTKKTKNEIAILKNDKNWSSLPVASETKDSEKTDSATPARAKTPSEKTVIKNHVLIRKPLASINPPSETSRHPLKTKRLNS